MDRASVFGTEGWGFESLRPGQFLLVIFRENFTGLLPPNQQLESIRPEREPYPLALTPKTAPLLPPAAAAARSQTSDSAY